MFDPRNLATLAVFAAVLALGLYGVLGQHREHKAVLMVCVCVCVRGIVCM